MKEGNQISGGIKSNNQKQKCKNEGKKKTMHGFVSTTYTYRRATLVMVEKLRITIQD